MKITYVYVDGFNLYHRAVKGTPYKWLDLKKLAMHLLRGDHRIEAIKYFTAIVSAPPEDPRKTIRQLTYIRALEAYIPELEVYYGHFLSHVRKAPLARPTSNKKFVKIIKTEEKGSDVNLAVHLLNDAWLNRYDCAVVISNDSDLAEAIRLVKKHHKKMIGIVLPPRVKASKELLALADFVKRIRRGVLQISQLPEQIPGTNIHRPPEW